MCDTPLFAELGPKQTSGDGIKERHLPQFQDAGGYSEESTSLFLWMG